MIAPTWHFPPRSSAHLTFAHRRRRVDIIPVLESVCRVPYITGGSAKPGLTLRPSDLTEGLSSARGTAPGTQLVLGCALLTQSPTLECRGVCGATWTLQSQCFCASQVRGDMCHTLGQSIQAQERGVGSVPTVPLSTRGRAFGVAKTCLVSSSFVSGVATFSFIHPLICLLSLIFFLS